MAFNTRAPAQSLPLNHRGTPNHIQSIPALLAIMLAALVSNVVNAATAEYGDRDVTIQLQQGVNLIAIPVRPTDPSLATWLDPLGVTLHDAHTFENGEWLSYSPFRPGFLRSFVSIGSGQGLVISVHAPTILVVEGDAVESLTLSMEPGWNYFPYSGWSSKSPAEVFQEVQGDFLGVYTFKDGLWKSYIPPAAASTMTPQLGQFDLTELEPGQGYWILVEAPAEWVFWGGGLVMKQRADLVVTDIETTPDELTERDSVTITTSVRNDGNQPALDVDVAFFRDDPSRDRFERIGNDVIARIDGDEVHTASTSITVDPGDPNALGLHFGTLLKVIVDEGEPVGSIPEFNEENNTRVEEVHILMPDPAVPENSLAVGPSPLFTDTTDAVLTADVENVGDHSAEGFILRFSIGDDETVLWSHDILFGPGGDEPILGVGESRQINTSADLSQILPGAGAYHFAAIVDPDAAYREISDENNGQPHPIYVPDRPPLTLEVAEYCCWEARNGPAKWDDVYVMLGIINGGTVDANNVTVTFEDLHDPDGGQWSPNNDDQENPTVTIATIPAGAAAEASNWLQEVTIEGNHTIELTVEYEDGRTVTLTAEPEIVVRPLQSDLIPECVTCFYVDQEFPSESSNPPLRLSVKNIGDRAQTADFDVRFYYTQVTDWAEEDLLTIGTVTVPNPLHKGESVDATIQWMSPPAGDSTLVARVDPDDITIEISEINNQSERTILIRQSGPDLAAGDIQSNPTIPINGQDARVGIEVVNAGDEAATFVTDFYIKDRNDRAVTIYSDEVTLAAEESSLVEADWTPEEYGWHDVFARVDYDDRVAESLEENNEMADKLYVRRKPISAQLTGQGDFFDKEDPDDNHYVSRTPGGEHIQGQARVVCSDIYQWTRGSVRLALYRTFYIDGEPNTYSAADIVLTMQALGWGQMREKTLSLAEYSFKLTAGVCEGEISSACLKTPKAEGIGKRQDVITRGSSEIDYGDIAVEIIEMIVCKVIGGGCDLILRWQDSWEAMQHEGKLYAGGGEYTMTDVVFQSQKTYTVYTAVDLKAKTIGLGCPVATIDFWIDEELGQLGLWLDDVQVRFK